MVSWTRLLNECAKSFRPPEQFTIESWAERYLQLSIKVTNQPGPFRAGLTPYVRGLFEAFRDPGIESIYLAFGAQTAKTTAMLVCLLYTLDQDPGPVLWAMPTETLARSFSQNRLQPLIDDTPRLAAYKPENLDRYKTLELQMRQGTIALVGGNSPSNLSSRPIRYLFADEVDKFPVETTREGSALALAVRRTASFWNRKMVISSTPSLASGQIWQGLLSGDWREYHVPCPKCGEFQTLTFHNIRIPEGLRDPEKIRSESWYECACCAARITDAQKPAMLEAGRWIPRNEPVPAYDWTPPAPGGRVASFHLPSWYSPWTPFGDVLARFIAAKPYPEVLREVINSDMASPWEERGEAAREEDVLKHRGEYAPGGAPSDAQVVTLLQTVDVQANVLYYVVRAWGPQEESWLIAYGVLTDFGALETTFKRTYGPYALGYCFIDSGYRTGEVYAFCRDHRPGCFPVKGVEGQSVPVQWSSVDRLPDGGILKGGLRLLTAKSSFFREILFQRFAIKRGDPGYWHLHAETGDDYARQIAAEVLVERKDHRGRIVREWRQVRRDNHYLDCEVYQLAAAHILGVRYMNAGVQGAAPASPPPPASPRNSWLPKRTGPWLTKRYRP